jgi:hypothetical protein
MARSPRRLTKISPNRVLGCEIIVISEDPRVGIITMETDDGVIELAVNRGVAEELHELLTDFMK